MTTPNHHLKGVACKGNTTVVPMAVLFCSHFPGVWHDKKMNHYLTADDTSDFVVTYTNTRAMINPSALLFWVSACLCPCLLQACPCLPSCLLHRHRATGWGCKGTLPFPSAPAEKKEAFLDLGKAGGWPHLDEKKKIKIILLLCSKLGMEWQSEFQAQDIALGWSGDSRGADGPG